MPKVACSTRSPTATLGTVFAGADPRPKLCIDAVVALFLVADWLAQVVVAAAVRRQSRTWCGTSSRNRDGGLYWGWPNVILTCALLRNSRFRARVTPT